MYIYGLVDHVCKMSKCLFFTFGDLNFNEFRDESGSLTFVPSEAPYCSGPEVVSVHPRPVIGQQPRSCSSTTSESFTTRKCS